MGIELLSFAIWNSSGVYFNQIPPSSALGPLAAWSGAPKLSEIHPKARRPHPASVQLVQLASALPQLQKNKPVGMIVGSSSGCLDADLAFQNDVQNKGAALGSPSLFVYTLSTAPLGELAIAQNSSAALMTVNAGAASGFYAFAQGVLNLQRKEYTDVLVGEIELGVANERIVLGLLRRTEAPSHFQVARGFGSAPAGFQTADFAKLFAAKSENRSFRYLAHDPLGFWASVEWAGN